MAAAAARDVLIRSAPVRRHTPAIEQLFATIAVLVDDTPTGTCMRPGCLRAVDHRSPSTWFCSSSHSEQWHNMANGEVPVLVSRLTLAECLMMSHVSDPLCGCGCIELFVALTVAASEDEGATALDARALLAQVREDVGRCAWDLAWRRARRVDSSPDQARPASPMEMTGDSFDIGGLPRPVETRVGSLYRALRGAQTVPRRRSDPADSDAVDAMRYMMAALVQRVRSRDTCGPYAGPPPSTVNCRCTVGLTPHPGPCQPSSGMLSAIEATAADMRQRHAMVNECTDRLAAGLDIPVALIAHIPRADAIDLGAGVPTNARERRRWLRFWEREFPNLRFWTRRQSS